MAQLDQAPHFAWPAHRETLEDGPVVTTGETITTALQSDPRPTETQIITKIFTSATDSLSKATENITSTTEKPINVQEKTLSKIENMLGSVVSTELTPLESSTVVETNPVNIITELFSKTVTTEKPVFENGHFNSTWEQPIASSKYPLIDTSEFGINMNTDSISTIDTMKDILTEAVLKEKGSYEEEATEKPISITSSTIRTLKDMFMRAVRKDTAKTESTLVDFKTSTEKPLFSTSTVEEPIFDIEKPFIQNGTLTEAPIEFNSTINSIADVFDTTSTEQSFIQSPSEKIEEMLLSTEEPPIELSQSTFVQLKDMLSTTEAVEEPSIVFDLGTKTNGTTDMIADVFNTTSTEQPFIQRSPSEKIKEMLLSTEEPPIELSQSTFVQLKDMLSTTEAVEEPSIVFDLGTKTNGTTDMIADVFNTTSTEQPFIQRSPSEKIKEMLLSTEEPPIELSQSTFVQLKGMLSTTEAVEEPSIVFDLGTKTNGTTDMIADVFNTTSTEQPFIQRSPSEKIKEMLLSTEEPPIELSQSTFVQLKDMLSTTEAVEEPSIVFDLGTKTNGTTDMIADVFNTTSTEQPFIQRSPSEKIKEMLLSTEEPPIELSQSTFVQLKDMLSTTEAVEEPSIVFDLGTKTNGTTDMIADVFNTTSTEQPFIQRSPSEKIKEMLLSTEEPPIELSQSTFVQLKDMLSTTEAVEEPSIVFDLGTKTNGTTDMIADVFNTTSTEQPFIQRSPSEKIKEMLLSTEEPPIELSQSTFVQLKDMLSTTEAVEEPSIVFDLGTKTNGTTDMIADVFNTTSTEQPFIQRSPSEKIKEMLLSTEEPPIELSQSTFVQLKDMLSTTEAVEEPSIVFDLGTKTNGTTDMIADVFNTTSTEQPFIQRSPSEKIKEMLLSTEEPPIELSQSTFVQLKDMLSTTEAVEEPPIVFDLSTKTNGTVDMIADVFHATTTEQTLIQTSTSGKIKEMLLSTEQPPIELSQSTFGQLKDMLSTTEAVEEPPIVFDLGTKTNGTTDMITDVFNRSAEQPFFQSTNTFDQIKDMLPIEEPSTEFSQIINTNGTVDMMTDIFNGSTSTEQTFVDIFATEEPSIEFGQSTLQKINEIFSTTEKMQDILPTTGDYPIQLGPSTNSNRTDLTENLFNGTASTQQTFVQNTSSFEEIKDVLSTTWATDETTSTAADMMKDIINRSTPTEQSTSWNNTFATLKEMITVSPTEFGTTSNDTLALLKNITTEQTFEEPTNIKATSTSTVNVAGIFRSAEKLNSTFDIFTTEMSTRTPFAASTSLAENNTIYFENNATSNSTDIFRTDPSIFQTTFSTDFMDPVENKTLTEDTISKSISPIKKKFEDVLSTISSTFNSTTEEALGDSDQQNQSAMEPSRTIYISLAVILAVLIIFTVGGYIVCRKYRKNRQSGGGYYITHLKDYSDSSVKTVSDSDTVNIRL